MSSHKTTPETQRKKRKLLVTTAQSVANIESLDDDPETCSKRPKSGPAKLHSDATNPSESNMPPFIDCITQFKIDMLRSPRHSTEEVREHILRFQSEYCFYHKTTFQPTPWGDIKPDNPFLEGTPDSNFPALILNIFLEENENLIEKMMATIFGDDYEKQAQTNAKHSPAMETVLHEIGLKPGEKWLLFLYFGKKCTNGLFRRELVEAMRSLYCPSASTPMSDKVSWFTSEATPREKLYCLYRLVLNAAALRHGQDFETMDIFRNEGKHGMTLGDVKKAAGYLRTLQNRGEGHYHQSRPIAKERKTTPELKIPANLIGASTSRCGLGDRSDRSHTMSEEPEDSRINNERDDQEPVSTRVEDARKAGLQSAAEEAAKIQSQHPTPLVDAAHELSNEERNQGSTSIVTTRSRGTAGDSSSARKGMVPSTPVISSETLHSAKTEPVAGSDELPVSLTQFLPKQEICDDVIHFILGRLAQTRRTPSIFISPNVFKVASRLRAADILDDSDKMILANIQQDVSSLAASKEDGIVLMPILCTEAQHWILVTVHPKKKLVEIYDSLKEPGPETRVTAPEHYPFFQYVSQAVDCIVGSFDPCSWTLWTRNCPRQGIDSNDCGVSVCLVAMHILGSESLPEQTNWWLWRRIMFELYKPQLAKVAQKEQLDGISQILDSKIRGKKRSAIVGLGQNAEKTTSTNTAGAVIRHLQAKSKKELADLDKIDKQMRSQDKHGSENSEQVNRFWDVRTVIERLRGNVFDERQRLDADQLVLDKLKQLNRCQEDFSKINEASGKLKEQQPFVKELEDSLRSTSLVVEKYRDENFQATH